MKAVFRWLLGLVENDNRPSLTRSAFAYMLLVSTTVLIWHCVRPDIITTNTVAYVKEMFLFVGIAWGTRGIADDVIEAIKK